MPQQWCLAPGQQLAARGWDDQFVVYNNLSGDTHLLDGDALVLLEHLRSAPASIASLATVLGEDLPPAERDALPSLLTDMLEQLQRLHLVLPC